VRVADALQWYKYICRTSRGRPARTVTFMPKPLYGDNGSGMHTHQSLWKGGKPLFAGEEYGGMSKMALWYIGGILKHAKAICAFSNPTMNSYKRLVPGFEAPVNLAYSSRNRSASVRIPMYSASPKTKRLEFRTPDPSCNGYLSFAAQLMRGWTASRTRSTPGSRSTRTSTRCRPRSWRTCRPRRDPRGVAQGAGGRPRVPAQGRRVHHRRDREVDRVQGRGGGEPVKLRPHPHEFFLYFDC